VTSRRRDDGTGHAHTDEADRQATRVREHGRTFDGTRSFSGISVDSRAHPMFPGEIREPKHTIRDEIAVESAIETRFAARILVDPRFRR